MKDEDSTTSAKADPEIQDDADSVTLGLLTRQILEKYLRDVGVDINRPVRVYNQDLDHVMREWTLSRGLESSKTTHLLKLIPTCVIAIDRSYPRASSKAKAYMAIYTMLFFYIDDVASKAPEQILPDFAKFTSHFSLDLQEDVIEPGLHLWTLLIASETHQHFGPYSTGAITKGMLDYILGTTFEARFPGGFTSTEIPQSAIHFLRDKTGGGEIFAHFIFSEALASEEEYLLQYFPSVRSIIDWINLTNDVMSFYKESVIGVEYNNYITNRARNCGSDPIDVLQKTCDELVGINNNVCHSLKSRPELGILWDEFLHGYIMFHVCDKRYHLSEIGLIVHEET